MTSASDNTAIPPGAPANGDDQIAAGVQSRAGILPSSLDTRLIGWPIRGHAGHISTSEGLQPQRLDLWQVEFWQ